MEFTYRYRVKTSDLWQASMYYAYSSYMGIVNVVCIVAAAVLLFSRWSSSSDLMKTVMLLFLLMFTVIQPVSIWMRAHSSLNGVYPQLELTFSQAGLKIVSDGHTQSRNWHQVKAIVKKPTILLIYMEDGAGYILRNGILKETKNGLFDFVEKMIRESR